MDALRPMLCLHRQASGDAAHGQQQAAQQLCQSQWGCGQAKAAHLGSVLHHAHCLGQICVIDMQLRHVVGSMTLAGYASIADQFSSPKALGGSMVPRHI